MKQKLLLILFLFFTYSSHAWWQQTSGPYGGRIQCLAVNGAVLFAGTATGVYVSFNYGSNWSPASAGLENTNVQTLLVSGSNIFAGTYSRGIYVSGNNGTTWSPANTGLPANMGILSLASNASILYAGSSGNGVYISTNNGNSWTAANTGIPSMTAISSFTFSGTSIFAGSSNRGAYLSLNNGGSWTSVNTGLGSTSVTSLASFGSCIFAGTRYNGVFRTLNNGANWSPINQWPMRSGAEVMSLAVIGTNLFAGTIGQSRNSGGVFLSADSGIFWTTANTGLYNKDVLSMAVSGGALYAGTAGGGVYVTGNNGTSWSSITNGIINTDVRALAMNGNGNLLAGTFGNGVFSSPGGSFWPPANSGMSTTEVMALGVSGSTVLAGMAYDGIYLSVNNGTTWSSTSLTGSGFSFKGFATDGTNFYAGGPGGAFISTNGGITWSARNNGLTTGWVNAMACLGTIVFAGTDNGGIYKSINNGANWVTANTGIIGQTIYAFAIRGSHIFAGGTNGVFLSTDSGNTWVPKNTFLAGDVHALVISGTTLYAGTGYNGVFVSTDDGNTWSKTGLDPQYILSLAVKGANLYAGTLAGGVWSRPLCSSSVTQNLTICNGQSITVGSHTYTSSGTYNDTLFNQGGCDSIVTTILKVDTVTPASVSAGGTTTFCSGGSVFLTANSGTGLSYQWKRNGVDIPLATASVYQANNSGGYACSVANACGTTLSNTIPVTVLPVPSAPGTITGLSSGICGNTTSYTVASVPGATAYQWSVPGGVIVNGGQGTASLNVTFPLTFVAGNFSVTASNSCGTSAASSLALSSSLTPAGTILGLTSVCAQKKYPYSITPVEGATTYQWTVPVKATIVSGQGTPNVQVRFFKTPGNITVTASNGCNSSATSVLPVTIVDIGCGPVHRDRRSLNAEVYPNPSSTAFTLKIYSDEKEICMVVIRDITGRILESRADILPASEITCGNDLASGVYLLEVVQGEDRNVVRLVKSQ